MAHSSRTARRPTPPRHVESQAPRQPPRRARDWLLVAVLLLTTFAAYQPAWRGGFLWDDDAHITRSDLRSTDGLRRIWVEVGATQQYYPLVHSAFWVQHALWGDNPLGYHLVSILLHALAACLLAVILRGLAVPWPWLAAFVFALHPVHVESVAWITELKNTLSGVLFLASAWAYLRFDGTRQRRMYGLAAGLFILALLSKTITATLPALLLVVCWWKRGRVEARRDVLPLVPFFALGAVFGVLTAWAERTLIGARGTAFEFTVVERCLMAGRAIWFYLGKLAWPADLMFVYPRWRPGADVWWSYLYPAGVVALFVAAWMWRRRSRAPLAALLYFCGALFPALGFFNIYPFRYSFVADHFQYLASVGVIALFAGSTASVLRRWEPRQRWTPAAAAAVILAPLAFLTWSQSHDYANADTLYRATLRRDPSCWMAHNNLAVLLLPGAVDEAMSHVEAALRDNPQYAEAHNNRGLALQILGRFDEAAVEHATALRLEPSFAAAQNNLGTALQKVARREEAAAAYREALRLRPDFLEARANLGDVLLEMGRPDAAASHYREVIRRDPTFANVHYNLANALETMGRGDEAAAEYREVLRIEPGAADAHARLGSLSEKAGRVADAISQYEAVVRLQPDSAESRLRLGKLLYGTGDWQRAAAQYEAALVLTPGSPEAHNNLGACLERLGRLEESVVQYREAVRLLPDSADAHANLARAVTRLGKKGR
jgi:tetratricopeptide (TPR) repeat protein